MYYIQMVQPKTPPLSIRLTPGLLMQVDRYAERRGLKRHGALLELIDRGLDAPLVEIQRIQPGPTTWPSGALMEPWHKEDPGLTLGSAIKIQVGPVRPKYGALAKKGSKK